jgi:NAD dependent epimerase/dehydratase family enzyme
MKLVLGEMAYLLFSSKNLSAQKLKAVGFQFEFEEIDKALQDLYT